MILSKEQLLSDLQDVTVTGVSTNIIDLGATGTPHRANAALTRDIGKGEPIPLEVLVNEAFLAAGSATLTLALQTSVDEAFTSPIVIKTTPAIGKADLVVGKNIFPDLFVPTTVDERYVRLSWTVATGPFTAGKITAGISMGRQTNV